MFLIILIYCVVFEVDVGSNKVRCKECFEADPYKTNWMAKGGAKRHTQTDEHYSNVVNNTNRRNAAAAQHDLYSATYAGLKYAEPNSDFTTAAASNSRPGLFDDMPDLLPGYTDDVNNDIFRSLSDVTISAGITPLVDDSAT